ncbi:MAG: Rpn family recombination-promoting nuclease/putative transposase [Eubacterium sp.]|jgi:predicted transposase/invertase (TIGR01784 family)|nr:Rpn family recombination-promoting nuclease/putative transposase [Eubacterium sp.]
MEERTLVSFDWALKSILRQKDNFDILEGFLSDLLNDKITVLALLESESNKGYDIDKSNRVDLRAEDSNGREIIIEVQYDAESDYLERVYYGTSKSLIENMREGYRYKNIKKIISVSIVYWKMLEKSYLIRGFMSFEDLTNNRAEIKVERAKDIYAEYYFIQPEWFNDNIKTKIDEWVYMFKHSSVKGELPATNIDSAEDKLNKLKMSKDERKDYDAYCMNKAVYEDVMETRENKGVQKMIDAMKKSGMSDEDIENIVKLSKSEE